MSHQFIKQPNGKWALWSTVVDDFLMVNATKEQIIKYELKRIIEVEKEECNRIFTAIEEKGRYFSMMTWEEAQETREEIHGKKIDL